MTTKMISLLVALILSFVGGYYIHTPETIHTKTEKILKIGVTKFQLDSITRVVKNKLDTLPKLKPQIIYKDTGNVEYVTTKGDTVYINSTDTIYPARFSLNDSFVDITGTTYYSLRNQNTFDISYTLKPRNLSLKTFWRNGQIENELSENGLKVPFKSKVKYDEYDLYIESLKPTWWDHWYIVAPFTFATTITGVIYLNKAAK